MKILTLFLAIFLMVGSVGASYHTSADAEVSVNSNANADTQAQASSDSNQAEAETNASVRSNIKKITVGGISASTDLDIELNESNQRFNVKLSNGRNAEIKIMPSTASATAIARLRLNVCSEENNCTIILKEVGRGDNVKAAYEVSARKEMKFLGLFRAKANVQSTIDAETGEVISVNRPWWAFVSTDVSASA
ncbi:hypothetical protein HYT24_02745 [Candidatus Pacearchaeota archaeon]|nr:hypothetical protein [Candidatus Pacearchaeota archaeon]